MSHRPPTPCEASYPSTPIPRFCSARAAARPDGPAPITAYPFMWLPHLAVLPHAVVSRNAPAHRWYRQTGVSLSEVSDSSQTLLPGRDGVPDQREQRVLRVEACHAGGERGGVLSAEQLLQLDRLLVGGIVELERC